MAVAQRPRDRSAFEIAILCALRVESNAVEALFDEFWDEHSYGRAQSDYNEYALGRILGHNVVLAYSSGMGKSAAASLAGSMRSSFTNIKLCLVVGVCGGVPFDLEGQEILLGDVVVSTGLIQYDFGRQYPDKMRPKKTVLDSLGRPSLELRSFISKLSCSRSRSLLEKNLASDLSELLRMENFRSSQHPGLDKDKLFKPTYRHQHRQAAECDTCAACIDKVDAPCDMAFEISCEDLGCSSEGELPRTRLEEAKEKIESNAATSSSPDDYPAPKVHFGLVASGDQVMKSGQHRDDIAKQQNVIAFEMEAAGVWDVFPTVVIKSVCDYADSHKHKGWQRFAAVSAAACTKGYLQAWQRSYQHDAYVMEHELDNVVDQPHHRETRESKFRSMKLIDAISRDDLHGVLSFISNGFNLNSHTRDGRSPLGLAVQNGNSLMVDSILECDVDVELAHCGSPPLFWASLSGDSVLVEMLLKHGANIDSRGDGAQTPLMIAVRHAHIHVVGFLLDKGSDVSLTDCQGRTALHIAASGKYKTLAGLVEALLAYNSNAEARDASGSTPLMLSISTKDVRIVSTFIKYTPFVINIAGYDGQTPLAMAVDLSLTDIATLLVMNGAIIDGVPWNTPLLHQAAHTNKSGMIKALIKNGADLHLQDESGCTALHVAAKNGSLEAFKTLISSGAKIDRLTADYQWALTFAASKEHWCIVEALLQELGRRDVSCFREDYQLSTTAKCILEVADHEKLQLAQYFMDNVRSLDDVTTLHIACSEGSKLFVKSLLGLGVRVDAATRRKHLTPLHFAAANGNLEIMQILVGAGAISEASSKDGWTALHLTFIRSLPGTDLANLFDINHDDRIFRRGFEPASRSNGETEGEIPAAKWLVRKNAPLNAKSEIGEAPLHIIARGSWSILGKSAAVEALIDLFAKRGANFNIRNKNSKTPLHIAIRSGDGWLIRSFLKHGAVCDAKDTWGNTPLHELQLRHGDDWVMSSIVEELLARGADINSTNNAGATSLLLGCERIGSGRDETVRRLLDSGANTNISNLQGNTPLHSSAELGSYKRVKILLDQGALIEARNKEGESALHLAALHNNTEIVALLLEESANAMASRKDGKTPADLTSDTKIDRLLTNYVKSYPPRQRTKQSVRDRSSVFSRIFKPKSS